MNRFDTHEVFNQAPPFGDVDLFACDPALREGLVREGAGWAEGELGRLGHELGAAAVLDLGRLANDNPPRLAWTRSNFTRRGTR